MIRILSIASFLGALVLAEAGTAAQETASRLARLQAALDGVVASDATVFPGAIVEVSHPEAGTYAVAAGVADIETNTPLTRAARFRAGSIAKTFVATVALQLVEEGRLSLDDTMSALLPEDVAARFKNSDRITLRMLLDHTSGIPEWLSDEVIGRIAANPAKVWDVQEFLDLAAAHPPAFEPGEGWRYSNTDYNLIGLVIERTTGQSWREAVTRRVIEPLGLAGTVLPEPGDTSIPGAFMHGYGMIGGNVVDLTFIDPSMAGAAGGGALVTTTDDLATFLKALLAGRLFKDPATLEAMADFVAAEGEGGRVGYGLGLEKYVLPGGIEMIGHSGGTAGYRSGAFYFPALALSMTFAMSANDNPLPVIFAALKVMAPDSVP
ncbi:MAG TPA: serine hydrolase domain-containing protein [Bauldia sp.]|nr:serine hydrolase domain-containing protein [Bauldia sp.]